MILDASRLKVPVTYLDSLATTPRCVLSLRRLISTATVAIRVRRSSDNTEQDIGFYNDELDIAALLAFSGAGSAYIVTWYDQTGNGENAEQSTSSAQPRIVNSGVFDKKIVWNGTSHFLKITSLAQGAAQFAIYGRIQQAQSATSKILVEASTNYNSATQAFLFFVGVNGATNVWSLNACNAAGSQRANQYAMENFNDLVQVSGLWNRSTTGSGEIAFYVEGALRSVGFAAATVEQTGTFTAYDTYIGARGGTTLFADMSAETLVFYNADTASIRTQIEAVITPGRWYWETRLNAPTSFQRIGDEYFLVDCWHDRIIYTRDYTKPVAEWLVMDDTNPEGPHSVATDGYMYVVDDTENERVLTYKRSATGGFTYIGAVTVANVNDERPHRVQYDAGTNAFYVINGGTTGDGFTREMVKLTRSGDTLSVADTSTLGFLSGGYSRGFRIIGGKMYIVAETAKVYEVSFNSTPTYTLDATYDLPTGWESPNDVYLDSAGEWWVTATYNKILKGASLSAIDAGTFTDMYATLGLGGTPYCLHECDGALFIPEIIARNGLTRYKDGVATVIHNYGTENADSLDRHNT